MKAMILRAFKEPLVLEEIPTPDLEEHQVRVKVYACGVCRSDLKIAKGDLPPERLPKLPHILGHEIAGIIDEVGNAVKNIKVGTRVVVYPYIGCSLCENCLKGKEELCESMIAQIGFNCNGGYAEFVVVPSSHVIPIPNEVDYMEAAIVPDAIATSLEAVKYTSNITIGHRVAIIGLGGLGIHIAQIAKLCGAYTIGIDAYEDKINIALKLGIDEGFTIEQTDRICKNGFHVVIDTVGTESSFNLARKLVKTDGTITLIGYTKQSNITIPTAELVRKNLSIKGSRGCSRKSVIEALELLRIKALKPIIGKIFHLQEANEALEELERGRVSGRALLKVS